MPSGAALPKTMEGHAPRLDRKGQVAVVCTFCGDGPEEPKIYGSVRQQRRNLIDWGMVCPKCEQDTLIPASIEVCAEATPELLHRHPGGHDEPELDSQPGPDDLCEGCGWRRPETGNPEYWWCPKCQGANGRRVDGSRSYEKAKFRSVEWERAMGMRLDRQEAKPKRRKAAVRVAPSVVDDIPF